MWDSRSYVVMAAFRAGMQLPDRPSGPTVHVHTLQTQHHHPQGQPSPRHPQNLPEAGIGLG